jgi:hypothetical protein
MALSSKSHHHSTSSSSAAVMMKFKCSEYSSSAAHQNLSFQSSSSDVTEQPKKRQQQQQQQPSQLSRELDDCSSVSSSSSSLVNSDFYFFANRGVGAGKGKGPDEISSETVDSGLSSDTEGFTPPPLPRRANKKAVAPCKSEKLVMLMDDSQSDVSADSLALNDDAQTELTSLASSSDCGGLDNNNASPLTGRKQALPSNLLTEIRTKAVKLHHYQQPQSVKELGKALDSQLKLQRSKSSSVPPSRSRSLILPIPPQPQQQQQIAPSSFDPSDCYYQRFHMCEYIEIDSKNNNNNINNSSQPESPIDDLSFVGLKDILNVEKSGQTIRSHKSGTVRGVRNRVRAGITTFLQGKTFKVRAKYYRVFYRFFLLITSEMSFSFSLFRLPFCVSSMGRVLSLSKKHSTRRWIDNGARFCSPRWGFFFIKSSAM